MIAIAATIETGIGIIVLIGIAYIVSVMITGLAKKERLYRRHG